MMNRRGITWKPFVWTLVIIVAIILVFWLVSSDIWPSSEFTIDTATSTWETVVGTPGIILNYIFGGIPTYLVNGVGMGSAAVVTFAVFLFIFITFGDIIDTFGTFSTPVAWAVGFLVAVIAANLKGVVVVVGAMTGIFAWLGTAAVFVGLGATFVAFIVVNMGIKGWAPWLMRRKAMHEAAKFDAAADAGGKKLASTVGALGTVGDSIADMGKKKGK